MGFFHIEKSVWINGHFSRPNHESGGVCIISQSGSGVAGIIDCEERINLNLSVSSGSELTVGAEDYLDYILHQESTTVVGLFLETIRKPEQMIQAFELAKQKKIPIIVLKDRQDRAICGAHSFSGGLAGVDDYYNALFKKLAFKGLQTWMNLPRLSSCLINPMNWQMETWSPFTTPEERGNSSLILPINKELNLQSLRIAPLKS